MEGIISLWGARGGAGRRLTTGVTVAGIFGLLYADTVWIVFFKST